MKSVASRMPTAHLVASIPLPNRQRSKEKNGSQTMHAKPCARYFVTLFLVLAACRSMRPSRLFCCCCCCIHCVQHQQGATNSSCPPPCPATGFKRCRETDIIWTIACSERISVSACPSQYERPCTLAFFSCCYCCCYPSVVHSSLRFPLLAVCRC